MRELEIKATSVENAISEGLLELGLTQEDVTIDIISKGGFLKKAVVKLTEKATCDSANTLKAVQEISEPIVPGASAPLKKDDVATATETHSESSDEFTSEEDASVIAFVQDLIDKMGLQCELKVKSTPEKLSILIAGADTNFAIGYRGEALDAIQYISLLASNKPVRFSKKLIIDAEGYRERRAETLTALSTKLAMQAIKSGKAIELEPMNPFERRVIHTALQENKEVTTLSEGEEPNRFVVICPAQNDSDSTELSKNNFKKSGFGKTRSFGQKKRRF